MTNTYEVLYDKLLVERMPEEDETKSGLEIPAKYREKQSVGTVLDVGQGRLTADGGRSPLVIQKGDIVLFNKFSGAELPDEDRELLILREDEVLARVKQHSSQLKAV
jgi:chaperonin GroES